MKELIKKINIKKVLPIFIILGAIVLAFIFIATSPSAPRMEPRKITPQAQAFYAERGDSPLFIEELGTLVASQSIAIKSKLAGTIATISPAFEAGSIVKKNTNLFTLESSDYKADLDKKLATLAKVKADYALEQGQQSVAQSDFNQLKTVMPEMKNMSTAESNLALRKPQLEQAKANVAIAEADVAMSRTAMNDTQFKAPFDGIITARLASTGQRITSGETLGELIATDKYHIEVGIAVDTLYSNKILSIDDEDLHIEILSKSGEIWEGNLLQIVGVLASGSRLGKMLISVNDPLALSKDNTKVPLLLGDQVTTRLEVGVFDDVFVLPRAAVRNNNTVWLIEKGQLKSVNVDVKWKDTTNMYVQSDEIPDRALFLASETLNATEGMQVAISVINEEKLPPQLKAQLDANKEARMNPQGQAGQGKRPEAAQSQRPEGMQGQRPEGMQGQRPEGMPMRPLFEEENSENSESEEESIQNTEDTKE